MARKISFSGQNLSLHEVASHHRDVEDGLTLFFSLSSPSYPIRFLGYRSDEVSKELHDRLAELDRHSTMILLAAVEAAFRVDYLQRCYHKGKDEISRHFREIYKDKNTRASLEDDIFEVWKIHLAANASLIGDLRGAFKFRHWMAHGRYWTPKLGRRYDYLSVYPLASQVLKSFPLMSS